MLRANWLIYNYSLQTIFKGNIMKFNIKKLQKLWLGEFICLLAVCQESFAASINQGQASTPDIEVVTKIPDLKLTAETTISSETLKLFRLIMYTIPMDKDRSDSVDLNNQATIKIEKIDKMPDNYKASNPLQYAQNRQLLKDRIGCRNVVVTLDEKGKPTMMVTGLGPK